MKFFHRLKRPFRIALAALVLTTSLVVGAWGGAVLRSATRPIVELPPTTVAPQNGESITVLPTPPPTATPSPTIAPTVTPTTTLVPSTPRPPVSGNLTGIIIGIDPGHQAHGNSVKEPNAPGSSVMKAKVTTGTQGTVTNIAEHVVNMQVALLLRDELTALGATVVMTRENANVDVSNAERAQMMNRAGCDLVIRIHCNGSENPATRGGLMLVPTVNPNLAFCKSAGTAIINAYCAEMGLKNLGSLAMSDQTGFNWSTVPVVTIEMGYMSNAEDDRMLTDPVQQKNMAKGMARGILKAFSA